MRITLVHPTGSNWIPGKKDITSVANRMAPLGLLSMASWLEAAGHFVTVLDCLGPDAPPDTDSQVNAILKRLPDWVGVSATTSSFLDGYALALGVKQRAPDVQTVFGGVHVSAIGGELLNQFPAIDCLSIGEGEQTLAELAAGESFTKIDGLAFRGVDGIITNPPPVPLPTWMICLFQPTKSWMAFPKNTICHYSATSKNPVPPWSPAGGVHINVRIAIDPYLKEGIGTTPPRTYMNT